MTVPTVSTSMNIFTIIELTNIFIEIVTHWSGNRHHLRVNRLKAGAMLSLERHRFGAQIASMSAWLGCCWDSSMDSTCHGSLSLKAEDMVNNKVSNGIHKSNLTAKQHAEEAAKQAD